MDKHIIVGIHILNREAHAQPVQHIFTEYGALIKTRLGLHDVHEGFSSSNGMILLEMLDTPETFSMIEQIKAIEGIDAQTMVFEH